MEPFWEKIGLMGRDNLLKSKIIPRVGSKTRRFVLKGEAGVGKTALLQWAFNHQEGKKAFVSAAVQYGTFIKQIAEQWKLSTGAKASEHEEAVLKEQGHAIYVDDLTRATPKMLDILRVLSDRHKVSGAMRSGVKVKEDLKQFLWGCETIKVPKLSKKDALRLSEQMCLELGSRISHFKVAHHCAGLPGRIYSAASTGEISQNQVRTLSEEIDISPVFIIMIACMVIFRYFGRALDATDLTMLGGAALVLFIILRGTFVRGKVI